MPTVATKNGGPVDIMQTLHSGLLVDPTKSKDIAAACLKILTQPETWDKMSHNGELHMSLTFKDQLCIIEIGHNLALFLKGIARCLMQVSVDCSC